MLLGCDPLQHTSIYQKRDDSDDSDGEGGMGNVNRIIMRPAGHSGKAKRGHLCFDASFETGNLGRVDLVNEYEYDLFIRPDTCSPRLRFWFNFTVDNVRQDQRVIFNIVNISKKRNLFYSNMTPIVKSSTRHKWQRIPKRYVYYQQSSVHRNHYILSFAFTFDKEDEVFQFALAPPYSYSRLQAFLTALEARGTVDHPAIFSREKIGESVQKRRLDLITMGTNKKTSKTEKRRVVVVMARVHPGEPSASYVCQGFLELLLSSHPVVMTLRDTVTFKVIPMLNPDGVFLGNYRSNLMGFDLNRSWHIASPFVHPTIKTLLDLIVEIDRSKEFQLDFVVDIHGHSNLSGCFIYGNTYEDVYRFERHIVFPKLMANVADDYAPSNTMFNADGNKIGSARRHLCSVLSDRVNCYSFEVSLFSYQLKGTNTTLVYTEDSYMRCGRNLLRTFFEYYQVTGVLVAAPQTAPSMKIKRRPHTSRSSKKNVRLKSPNTANSCGRPKALLHFNDLCISVNYDSDTSAAGDELATYRHAPLSPDRFTKRRQQQQRHHQPPVTAIVTTAVSAGTAVMLETTCCVSPPPVNFVSLPEPSLSIIDFNIATRRELDRVGKSLRPAVFD